MTTTALEAMSIDDGRGMSADEIAFRQRFDAPGLWPASTTALEREDFLLWAYIQHLRTRWEQRSRMLRPSLWLRIRVAWRAAWIGVDDPSDL